MLQNKRLKLKLKKEAVQARKIILLGNYKIFKLEN